MIYETRPVVFQGGWRTHLGSGCQGRVGFGSPAAARPLMDGTLGHPHSPPACSHSPAGVTHGHTEEEAANALVGNRRDLCRGC